MRTSTAVVLALVVLILNAGITLVLINQNPGPGVSPQNSGEVWMMVDANTPGLVPIGNATAPTPTSPTIGSCRPTTVGWCGGYGSSSGPIVAPW